MAPRALLLCCFVLAACGSTDRSAITVYTSAEDAEVISSFTSRLKFPVKLEQSKAPLSDVGSASTVVSVALVRDLDCDGCYRIEADGEHYKVHGGGVLGVQYGLAEVLEAYGFGFFHPKRTHEPSEAKLVGKAPSGEFTPKQQLRGLHLHTLHPIEGYFAVWEPSPENLEDAKGIIDWVIKNRGNYLQWFALDDIQRDPARLAAWTEHTRQILEEAHRRGVKVGISVQLFGSSNLQKAFDLIDGNEDPPDPKAAMKERLKLLLGLPFDVANLSFGEFSGIDPDRFIARVNDAYAAMTELSPNLEVTTLIHVGKDVTATYNGQTMIYYFLVQFADPHIVPWVHSVMYYDLFEDAGGAYGHDMFTEHRDFLLGRLKNNQRVAYYPESGYWVAFDNCVPTYLPLYARSRFTDMQKIDEAAAAQGSPGLNEHVLFSTGWEWGYWQADALTLRSGFSRADTFAEAQRRLFAPYGENGNKLADTITKIADVQDDALITKRLAPWFAARDGLMDVGKGLGIISQPDRPYPEEVMNWDEAKRADFDAKVVQPMKKFAADLEAIAPELDATGLATDDPFLLEVKDGLAIDVLRAKYAYESWTVPLLKASGGDAAGALDRMDALLAQAKTVVSRRRDGMHEPNVKRLIRPAENQTVYPYGYLTYGDTLCFWQRERVQTRALVYGIGEAVPACVDIDAQ